MLREAVALLNAALCRDDSTSEIKKVSKFVSILNQMKKYIKIPEKIQ